MPLIGWLKALADATRLRILNLTLEQELNVQELMGILSMGQSRISRHLKILAASGLLVSRRDGLWSLYRVPIEGSARGFLDSIAPRLAEEPEYMEDLKRCEEALAAGRSRSRKFFDALAPEWDRRKREILGQTDLDAEILKKLPECAVAADLGCGTGALLEGMRRRARVAVGVDGSARMLELARRRYEASGEAVQLRIGELEHLPLRDGEADAVVLNLVLHHLRSPLLVLREAHRVLRGGGRLVLADFRRHEEEALRERFGDRWLGFSAGELEGWLREAGFEIEERTELPLAGGLAALLYTGRRTQ